VTPLRWPYIAGDNCGVIAGTLYDFLPIWALFLPGTIQNVIGYGSLWLAAAGRIPKPPFWAECLLICVGESNSVYFTASFLLGDSKPSTKVLNVCP
jgi:hypothetical protein